MNVIGISGLHNSLAFKQEHFPHLDSNCQRIAQGLDSAAALVSDRGVVAAAAQERFCGDKGTGTFPAQAIDYCLSSAGLTIDQVDCVAHGFAYEDSPVHDLDRLTRERYERVYARDAQLAVLREHFPRVDWESRLVSVPHHMAHAASSYFLSGLDRALIVVADGMGEWESLTVAVGSGDDIRVIRQVPAMHSLGILYGAFTLYLGFMTGMDEYKVMGLAPYGNPHRYLGALMENIRLRPNGEFSLALLARDRTTSDRESHAGVMAELTRLFGPARRPEDPIEPRHMDIAAALQSALQRCLMHVLRWARAETREQDLCLAGGVALNCTANGAIYRSGLFRKIHVQPASGDDGSALGAALMVHRQRRPSGRWQMSAPAWGPEFSNDEIDACLDGADCDVVRYERTSDLLAETARLLSDGEVIGWFQGRMEFGPRALGNRSLLADPRRTGMREHLNGVIKQREEFRPFAPAVTREAASRYFDIAVGDEDMFANMLIVAETRPPYRTVLPAVTHVDGTARVQVVGRGGNERFWRLLRAFERITELPVLLNTSFNLRGQPIVCTPAEALETFLRSSIDRLVMGDRLISRRPSH